MKEQLDTIEPSRCLAPISLTTSCDKTTSASGPGLAEPPLVSVVIPAYNAERFIAQTLDSVLAQTYSNIEVLVVDDGSKDGTAAIVEQYMQQDCRIQLFRQLNAGVAAARNLGIEKSRGKFIAPLDADDIWRTENLEKQVNIFLRADDRVGIVYSWSFYIDEDSCLLNDICVAEVEGYFYTVLLCHNFIGNASATLIRSSCLKDVGGYSTRLMAQDAQGCEDFDLYLRIGEYYQIRAVPDFLVGYRKYSKGMSSDYKSMARSHELVLQSSHRKHPEIPSIIYNLSRSSLYLYFARQSYRENDSRTTLFWLSNSLRSSWGITFLRPEFYTFGIRCFANLLCGNRQIGIKKEKNNVLKLPNNQDLSVRTKVFFCDFIAKILSHFHPSDILEL